MAKWPRCCRKPRRERLRTASRTNSLTCAAVKEACPCARRKRSIRLSASAMGACPANGERSVRISTQEAASGKSISASKALVSSLSCRSHMCGNGPKVAPFLRLCCLVCSALSAARSITLLPSGVRMTTGPWRCAISLAIAHVRRAELAFVAGASRSRKPAPFHDVRRLNVLAFKTAFTSRPSRTASAAARSPCYVVRRTCVSRCVCPAVSSQPMSGAVSRPL